MKFNRTRPHPMASARIASHRKLCRYSLCEMLLSGSSFAP
jgi:hypothetical protein